ncbi:hypothetical protein OUZ56_019910 [Daphnia magna]|uniref:Uncharacterized protein n=1 Tax=Daphnia magna TaxID=35525 RepID=A0ABQ9ZDP3_9CRUS|nr:hypothetical protein OUZ56_019910 [Daphnia magna]
MDENRPITSRSSLLGRSLVPHIIMKFTLRVITVCAVVSLAMARQLSPSRGRVKWPGIRLGEAIISPDIFAESILVDDMTEENLLRALVIPTDGSGGAPIEESERFDTRANRNASYHFRSDVRDGIKGGQLHREETRRGAQVNGSYSYSDGFVLRTVEYQADENGYRVIKETMRRIGNGPKENTAGVANVQTEAHGRKNRYTIRGTNLTAPSISGAETARIISKRL